MANIPLGEQADPKPFAREYGFPSEINMKSSLIHQDSSLTKNRIIGNFTGVLGMTYTFES